LDELLKEIFRRRSGEMKAASRAIQLLGRLLFRIFKWFMISVVALVLGLKK